MVMMMLTTTETMFSGLEVVLERPGLGWDSGLIDGGDGKMGACSRRSLEENSADLIAEYVHAQRGR